MPTVEVTFTPLPAHVRTARLVATAVARRSGVDEALLDEVRLAVGEACSRAVEAHRRHCPAEPVRLELTDLGERFEVVVTDAAPPDAVPGQGGIAPVMDGAAVSAPDDGTASFAPELMDSPDSAFPAAFGLAVISGLADDVRISPTDSGLSVRMSWPAVTAAM
ncbi:MAG TPA: ATP-binding protein [Streptosporangiaceae bacterium]|jgi:anti-sigma regulatory factor (Ser/Thr protein kinase)|nr:ATP-binding protein [Streptosporangiaceae bacterium]